MPKRLNNFEGSDEGVTKKQPQIKYNLRKRKKINYFHTESKKTFVNPFAIKRKIKVEPADENCDYFGVVTKVNINFKTKPIKQEFCDNKNLHEKNVPSVNTYQFKEPLIKFNLNKKIKKEFIEDNQSVNSDLQSENNKFLLNNIQTEPVIVLSQCIPRVNSDHHHEESLIERNLRKVIKKEFIEDNQTVNSDLQSENNKSLLNNIQTEPVIVPSQCIPRINSDHHHEESLIERNLRKVIKKEFIEDNQTVNSDLQSENNKSLLNNIQTEPVSVPSQCIARVNSDHHHEEPLIEHNLQKVIKKELIEENQSVNSDLQSQYKKYLLNNIQTEPVSVPSQCIPRVNSGHHYEESLIKCNLQKVIKKELIEENQSVNSHLQSQSNESSFSNILTQPVDLSSNNFENSSSNFMEIRIKTEPVSPSSQKSTVSGYDKVERFGENIPFADSITVNNDLVDKTVTHLQTGGLVEKPRKVKQTLRIEKDNYFLFHNSSSLSQHPTKPIKYKLNKPPVLEKIVLPLPEKLSQQEKEKIELEKDRRCEEAAKRTGQIWRRCPSLSPKNHKLVPKPPDVVVVFTPAGQPYAFYPNVDRPDEFPNEEARAMWDHASSINIRRTAADIESGDYIPEGLDKKKEQDLMAIKENANLEFKKFPFDMLKNEIDYFKLEKKLLKFDFWVKTRLPYRQEEIGKLMNEIIIANLPKFLFIKHFQVFFTIKMLTKENCYPELKKKASIFCTKIKNIFGVPEKELGKHIFELGKEFRTIFKDLPITQFMALPPSSIELVARKVQINSDGKYPGAKSADEFQVNKPNESNTNDSVSEVFMEDGSNSVDSGSAVRSNGEIFSENYSEINNSTSEMISGHEETTNDSVRSNDASRDEMTLDNPDLPSIEPEMLLNKQLPSEE